MNVWHFYHQRSDDVANVVLFAVVCDCVRLCARVCLFVCLFVCQHDNTLEPFEISSRNSYGREQDVMKRSNEFENGCMRSDALRRVGVPDVLVCSGFA